MAENIYKRGSIWWCRYTVGGKEQRESLRTSDRTIALKRAKEAKDRATSAHHFGETRASFVDAFVAWSAHLDHDVSPRTADRYRCSFRQFDQHLKNLWIDEINGKVVRAIIAVRRTSGAVNATIRRDLTSLSRFLEFCTGEGWRPEDASNPALAASQRLKERRDPIILPVIEDVERVIARAPGNMKALIRAARLTGCRLDELVTADRRRLDRQRKQLVVIGKGRKLRTVSLWRDGALECMTEVIPFLGSPLLFHHDGEPYRNLSGQFRDVSCAELKAAQKEKREFQRFRFHDLRHLYAVEALKLGRSIYDVQMDLGHSSIAVTEMYLSYLTPEEAAAARKSAHAATVSDRAEQV